MYGNTTLVAPMMLGDGGKEICIRTFTERRAHFTSKVPKAIEEATRQERREVGCQAGAEGSHEVHQHRNHQNTLTAARVCQRTPHIRAENHSCKLNGGKISLKRKKQNIVHMRLKVYLKMLYARM